MSVFTRTALAAALLAAAPLALAQSTTTDTMQVSITIENACTVNAADLAFGAQDSLAADIDATADVTVDCSNQGAVDVAFSAGGSGDQTARQMASAGGDTINYQIYSDSGRTSPLGDGTGGTSRFAATSTGGSDTFRVYGRVPGGQGAKPVGAYTDSLTATLTY